MKEVFVYTITINFEGTTIVEQVETLEQVYERQFEFYNKYWDALQDVFAFDCYARPTSAKDVAHSNYLQSNPVINWMYDWRR